MLALAAEKLVFKNVNDEKDRIQGALGGAKFFLKKVVGQEAEDWAAVFRIVVALLGSTGSPGRQPA